MKTHTSHFDNPPSLCSLSHIASGHGFEIIPFLRDYAGLGIDSFILDRKNNIGVVLFVQGVLLGLANGVRSRVNW